jgi:hypothetical protein
MEQKDQTDKNEQEMKSLETQIVIEQDRQDLEQEKQKQNDRIKSLLQVTSSNKEVRKDRYIYISEIRIFFLFS